MINSYIITAPQASELPAAAVGVWYSDEWSATPLYVPNSISEEVAPNNLLSAPRRLFADGAFYVASDCTVVDAAALAPDASNDASTVVWGSIDGFIILAGLGALPANTYTLACWVKSTSGSPVQIRMGVNGSMATKTATTSWARITTTFTQASLGAANLILVRALDTATPASLAIIDAALFVGTEDLGSDVLAGHMRLGITAFDSGPSYSSGSLDLSAGRSLVQFAEEIDLSNFTAIAVTYKTGVSAIVNGFLSKAQDYTEFTPTCDANGSAFFQFGGANPITTSRGLWSFASGGGWHAKTVRYGGGEASMWLDDIKALKAASSGLSAAAADFFTGSIVNQQGKHAFNSMALWDRTLTDEEVRTAVAVLTARAALSSLTIFTERFLCAIGDSITFGSGASNGSYAYLFGPHSSPVCYGAGLGVPGSTLADLISRAAETDALIPPEKNGRIFILVVLIGTNNLPGYPGGNAQFAEDVGDFILDRKTERWDEVLLCTIPPSTAVGFNPARNTVNAIWNGDGWAAAHGVSAIVDFAADATIGTDAAASDPSLYPDGTHPSNTAQAAMELVFRAVMNAL